MRDFDSAFKVVRFYDPAIVEHNPDEVVVKYLKERDFDTLTIPPEAAPVIFNCKLLTRAQRRLVANQANDHSKRELAFRFGVQLIENLPTDTGPRTVEPARKRKGAAISDETMDELDLRDDDEQEIGHVIQVMSFLPRDVPQSLPALDSSAHAYGVVASRLAERRVTSADETAS